MSVPIRNHDIAELRRLDLAHHLPAQADHRLIASLGGSRIITRAEGSTIFDGEGNAILDGMAGLWCVNVGYGREELAKAAYDQMLELPYYKASITYLGGLKMDAVLMVGGIDAKRKALAVADGISRLYGFASIRNSNGGFSRR